MSARGMIEPDPLLRYDRPEARSAIAGIARDVVPAVPKAG